MSNGLSVIIPSYNSVRTVETTLKALLEQPEGSVSEIVVVDSSDDGRTPALVWGYAERFPKIRLVSLEQKTFPGTARNVGVMEVRGERLAFVDSDAYPAPDWAPRIVAEFEKGRRVGGGSINLPPFQRFRWLPIAQLFFEFNEFMDTGEARHKEFVTSCNLFCERALFEKAGGFPGIRATEDVLFGLKMNTIEKVWFDPQIKVYHIFREKISDASRNQVMLGKYIGIYRRLDPKAPFYVKRPWAALFLPGFLVIKFIKITLRICKARPGMIARYVAVFPAFVWSLLCWTVGFAKGVFTDERKEESIHAKP